MLVWLALGQHCCPAGEPEKPVSAVATPVSSTNVAAVTPESSRVETNALSLGNQSQLASTNLLTTTTNRSLPDFTWNAATFSLKQADDDATDLFSDQQGNGHFGFANFQAGYGQLYDSDSIVLRGRNGTSWEEPRYLFVKKVIRF